jgi:hypothetical protein
MRMMMLCHGMTLKKRWDVRSECEEGEGTDCEAEDSDKY